MSEETFLVNENKDLNILAHASTLENLEDKEKKYEVVTKEFSKIKGLRYSDFTLSSKLNPAQYRKMDNFSKMIANTVAKAIERSSLDLKKLDLNKVGILFTTSSGPIEVVEDIEKQLRLDGYKQVSAAKFPFTVMNAAAGMLSILFKIKGPVSVIASNVGFIDGVTYAEEMMKNEKLSHVLLVSATQWTDLSLLAWEKLGYDANAFTPADYCHAAVIGGESEERTPRFIGIEQLKYDNKVHSQIDVKGWFINTLHKNISNLRISATDIKKIIWNSNKKTATIEYEMFQELSMEREFPFLEVDLGFSSDGAGEELDFVLNNKEFQGGIYVIASYSRFGGFSLMFIEK
ncbi:beta-ketoacyl synthase N-terminal-like domain-containing protein [Lactococcus allomyrinae]|uniref:beta-ketoacyl synthase N-terminal-like domain-containing protein n=1 Tax=Lactococcus allomyrinae TaxID=2419773 RepID=UPI001F096941|nr:beta-ketoacyl synthase N-terminal-like domain-containing protein [Lactococcus allomyrinae]